MSYLSLCLTPHGHLRLEPAEDAPLLERKTAERLAEAFNNGTGQGLLRLGAGEIGQSLPPVLAWWRGFASRYVGGLCQRSPTSAQPTGRNGGAETGSFVLPEVPPPEAGELASLTLTAPMMPGAEYLTPEILRALWAELGAAFAAAFAVSGADLQSFLKRWNPAWNLVGRVHFNLAENRRDPDFPFAFMATYTTRLSADARAQHVPLGQALRDHAGKANRDKLLALLLPVQRAAANCPWLKALVDDRQIFQPLRWGPAEAAQFLSSLPQLEEAGVIVRMPASWNARRPARPQVTATVGAKAPSGLGLEGLLDFRMAVTLEGETLTDAEITALLSGTDTLVLLRGRWVEIDRARLERTMQRFQDAEALAEREGLNFAEALRLLAGTAVGGQSEDPADADWSRVSAGPWLAETLKALRAPDAATRTNQAIPGLRGSLRPYQQAGVQWLRLLSGLGLGACLADDMGLGKTIQVLSLLLQLRQNGMEQDGTGQPSLLVAPASLLANWTAEIERFAPDLKARIVHPSAMPAQQLRELTPEQFSGYDLAITSYGSLLRIPALTEARWRLVVLDEAQAIKNAKARQTRAAKALRAEARIALTGTPVENHLGELWSIFDFINPGLLGTARQFAGYANGLADRPENPYGPLRELVRPYILRRMKTDRSVIADLPDKTEIKAYCTLSRKQAALYEQTVVGLSKALEQAEGIQRKGIVLATLMRLKQICNHPSQWLGDQIWAEADSGKWARLREIAEVIAARQEKLLVFTQFREMTAPLAGFLGGIFGRPGRMLHGGVAVKDRKDLVRDFQEDETVPFFVLSLKAGGSGLTLTAASHVVHFDRWWNPAVENQATDRAFRIGQRRNVVVHKFICQGTIEEKIDASIEAKKVLSEDLLADTRELDLTAMKDDALLRLVTLDLNAAMRD